MARTLKSKRKRAPKTILKLPDLEQSKSAVVNSLTSPSSQRSYDHAIREFIDWYCSEPRLAFNKTVVTRLGKGCRPTGNYPWTQARLSGLIVVCFGRFWVLQTTSEVFTRISPDNSLERLTECGVGLVTDQSSDFWELFVTPFK